MKSAWSITTMMLFESRSDVDARAYRHPRKEDLTQSRTLAGDVMFHFEVPSQQANERLHCISG